MITVICYDNVKTMVMNYCTEIVTFVYDKQELHEYMIYTQYYMF